MKKKRKIILFLVTLIIVIATVQIAIIIDRRERAKENFRNEFNFFISQFPTVTDQYVFTKNDLTKVKAEQPIKLEDFTKFLRSETYGYINVEQNDSGPYFPLFKIRQGQELSLGYFTLKGDQHDIVELHFCSSNKIPFFGNSISRKILIDKITSDTLLVVDTDQIITTLNKEVIDWGKISELNSRDTIKFTRLTNYELNSFKDLVKR